MGEWMAKVVALPIGTQLHTTHNNETHTACVNAGRLVIAGMGHETPSARRARKFCATSSRMSRLVSYMGRVPNLTASSGGGWLRRPGTGPNPEQLGLCQSSKGLPSLSVVRRRRRCMNIAARSVRWCVGRSARSRNGGALRVWRRGCRGRCRSHGRRRSE